jgi:hypothetical protein
MMALWWLNKDEPWYQELPTWEKTIFAHMKIGDKIIRLPMPFEWGILFGSMPVAIADSIYQKDPKRLKDGFDQALKTVLPDFIPQAGKPLIEALANKDLFRDRPIESRSMQQMLPTERYRESTPGIYRAAGRTLGVSPAKVQHVAESYTGGLIREPANMLDVFSGKIPSESANIPVLGRIFSNQDRQGQSVDDFYTQYQTMQQAWTTARKRQQAGDIKGARRVLEDNADVLGLSPGQIELLVRTRKWKVPEKVSRFNKVADAMSAVRKRKGEASEITNLARMALGRGTIG